MKLWVWLILTFGLWSGTRQPISIAASRGIPVSILILHTRSYCGGDEPDPSTLTLLATPAPYVGKKLYLRRGPTNQHGRALVDSLVAGPDGWAHVRLLPGEYVVLHPLQRSVSAIQKLLNAHGSLQVDDSCLLAWNSSYIRHISVQKGQPCKDTMYFHVPCFQPEGVPCVGYTGEYPP